MENKENIEINFYPKNYAVGSNSIAFGLNATAFGSNSVAVGLTTKQFMEELKRKNREKKLKRILGKQ